MLMNKTYGDYALESKGFFNVEQQQFPVPVPWGGEGVGTRPTPALLQKHPKPKGTRAMSSQTWWKQSLTQEERGGHNIVQVQESRQRAPTGQKSRTTARRAP